MRIENLNSIDLNNKNSNKNIKNNENIFEDNLINEMNTFKKDEKNYQIEKINDYGVNKIFSSFRIVEVDKSNTNIETQMRKLSYDDCDMVKINILDGYTLKAKLIENEKNKIVYIEKKYDDGKIENYNIDIEKIFGNTKSEVEQVALEVVEKYKNK